MQARPSISFGLLKQVYCKYMFEAELLTGKSTEKQVVRAYVDPNLRFALEGNAMDKYLAVLIGADMPLVGAARGRQRRVYEGA